MNATARRRARQRARARRRRRAAGAVLGAAAAGAAAAGVLHGRAADENASAAAVARARPVTILLAGQPLANTTSQASAPPATRDQAARRLVRRLPVTRSVRVDRARLTFRVDRVDTARRAVAARGPRVAAVATVRRSDIAAPVLQQAQRNSCETAALSILLATTGKRVAQTLLQRQLARSGPLDPAVGRDGRRRWGDPDRGYVGRADGGGTAGGFGVYPGPIKALAARHERRLLDLSGRSPASVYARLRAGRAVMTWVGLSDGPYGQWTAPSGKAIRANFGEHTVVLHGIREDGSVQVSNPLEGTEETWSASKFESMWQLLGRRALSA